MAERPLRLGTRGSHLAQTQSGIVARAVTQATGREVELVVIKTKGDMVRDRPLSQVGGKGLFTKEIEDAMLAGQVDFAVHSMKDMPTDPPEGLVFAAVPEREDPRDAMVGARLSDLPSGARVGTGSARRRAQILALRPDLTVLGIRGNIDTRIRKQVDGEYDAIMLAASGMARVGRKGEAAELVDPDAVVPAVGQGALAIQCRESDADVRAALATIHHEPTGIQVRAERAFLVTIEGGCSVPAACYARYEGDQLRVTGIYAPSEGHVRRAVEVGDPADAHALGVAVARRVLVG